MKVFDENQTLIKTSLYESDDFGRAKKMIVQTIQEEIQKIIIDFNIIFCVILHLNFKYHQFDTS